MSKKMSQKWRVMCLIWIVCGVVAIVTNSPGVLWFPAIGTILAAEC